jgi:hypothetical protein
MYCCDENFATPFLPLWNQDKKAELPKVHPLKARPTSIINPLPVSLHEKLCFIVMRCLTITQNDLFCQSGIFLLIEGLVVIITIIVRMGFTFQFFLMIIYKERRPEMKKL